MKGCETPPQNTINSNTILSIGQVDIINTQFNGCIGGKGKEKMEKKNTKEHFEVETLDGEIYNFKGMCNNIDYSDRIYVAFKNGDNIVTLLPHRVIGCIYVAPSKEYETNDKN